MYFVSNNTDYDNFVTLFQSYIHRRNLSDFGNMSLVEDRDAPDGNKSSLPADLQRKKDLSLRTYTNDIRVTSLRFSPTGERWGATTSEGLLLFSSELEETFDPLNATTSVTPENVKSALVNGQFDVAVVMALQLNMDDVIKDTLNAVPFSTSKWRLENAYNHMIKNKNN
jgi:periodic tryptophan protein 2